MNEAEIKEVRLADQRLTFDLTDGRSISVPLTFYPTLFQATNEQRNSFEIYPCSVYWPELDVDIGVEGLLQGACEMPIYINKKSAANASSRS